MSSRCWSSNTESAWEQLLKWRRNLFVTLPGGTHAVLSATPQMIVLHTVNQHFEALESSYFDFVKFPALANVYDGAGWNLYRLLEITNGLGATGRLATVIKRQDRRITVKRFQRSYAIVYAQMSRKKRSNSSLQNDKQPPYAPLLAAAMREISPELSDAEFRTLVVLALHGNAYATCFPGLEELSRITTHRKEDIVDEIGALEALGLVRFLQRRARNPITGMWLNNIYQISPDIYYIPVRLRAVALALGSEEFVPRNFDTRKMTDNEETPSPGIRGNSQHKHQKQYQVSNPSQVNPESTTTKQWRRGAPSFEGGEPGSYTQGYTAHKNGKVKDNGKDWETGADFAERQYEGYGGPGEPTSEAATAPNGATKPHNPPYPPSPQKYGEPLSDPALEQLAQEVRTVAPTRLWQARELVYIHVRAGQNVRQALEHLERELDNGTVRNPFGLLKSWLDDGMFRGEPEMHRRSKYTSGQFAEQVES